MLKAIYISYDGVLEALGQSQVLPYVKGLAGKGIRFFLISFEKKALKKDLDKVNSLRSELVSHGIEWIALTYHKKPFALSTVYDICCGLLCSIFIIFKERPGVVQGRSYVASLIAWFLKRIFGLKFIFDMRGFWAEERVEGKIWKSKNRISRLVKIIERFFLKDADEIVVLTSKAKSIIKDWGYGIENVSVIPSCVDTGRFKFFEESRIELRNRYGLIDSFIFVHTGSLEYWYMKDKMLDYFKACLEIFQKAHFLILSHDVHDKIKKLILDRRLDLKYFTILSCPFDDMSKYLSMADAGIFFITPVFSKLASSPTKFAEYLSCGLPVISNSGVGDVEEYVTNNDTGVIVRGFNENEYRESFEMLLKLTQDKDLRCRCRLTACNNFSCEIGVEKYYEIYSRLD